MCGIKPPPRPANRKQVTAWPDTRVYGLIDHMPDEHQDLGWLGAGLRQGECFGLAEEDFNRKRKLLSVTHQVQRANGVLRLVPPKWNSYRTLALDDEVTERLATRLDTHSTVTVTCACCPGETWDVIYTNNGKLIDYKAWNEEVWHPALHALDIEPAGKKTGFHNLRHYYASVLIEGGASPVDVARVMGHRSVQTTLDLYGHMFDHGNDKIRSILVSRRAAGTPTGAHVYPIRTTNAS